MKRNLLSLGALGLFTILAFGSKQSSFDDDDFEDLFGDEFEAELEAAMEEAFEELEAEAAGGGGGSYSDNVEACRAWVDKQNALSCWPAAAQMSPDEVCPSAINQSPTDMRPYYTCMADNAKCNGNIPDLGGQSSCSP
jgi:hypothetical protein